MAAGEEKEKMVALDDLQPGMQVAEDIENKFGGTLIPEGAILDRERINRLKMLDISLVKIKSQTEEERQKNVGLVEDIDLAYRQLLDETGLLFERFNFDREVEYAQIAELTDRAHSLAEAVSLNDILILSDEVGEYEHTHMLNAALVAGLFARWLDLKEERVKELTAAGLIHDLGKTEVPDEILEKPGDLSPEEYREAKKHVQYSHDIAKRYPEISQDIARGVWTHHERFDGSGYPHQLAGDEIPLYGRILAIVDVFDAITSERVYSSKRNAFKAIKYFQESDFRKFDPRLKKIFLDRVPDYFLNKRVRLSDGREAEIVFMKPGNPDHLILRCEDDFFDLNESDLEIEEMIDT